MGPELGLGGSRDNLGHAYFDYFPPPLEDERRKTEQQQHICNDTNDLNSCCLREKSSRPEECVLIYSTFRRFLVVWPARASGLHREALGADGVHSFYDD